MFDQHIEKTEEELQFDAQRLPDVPVIEEFNEEQMQTLVELRNNLFSSEELQKNEELNTAIEDFVTRRDDILGGENSRFNQAFLSIYQLIDEIKKSEENFNKSKTDLEKIRERGIQIGKEIDAFNNVCRLMNEFNFIRSHIDINIDPFLRSKFKEKKQEFDLVNTEYENAYLRLLEFKDTYSNATESLYKLIIKHFSSTKNFVQTFNNADTVSIESEKKEVEGCYNENIKTDETDNNLTIGKRTVLLKYSVVVNCLESTKGVEVLNSNNINNTAERDNIILISNNSEYMKINFKYNNTDYIALVANKYGNAIYLISATTFDELQRKGSITKKLMRDNGATTINWNIQDESLEEIAEEIYNLPKIEDIRTFTEQSLFILSAGVIISKIAGNLGKNINEKLRELDKSDRK